MPDNVEATQNLFRIWNTREFEALIPFVTEDVVWKPATMEAVEVGSFEGIQELRKFFDEWDQTWRVWEVQPREIREVGDQVLVLGHVHAEGRESGLELDQPAAYLFEFRDGLLARGATYFDLDEAIAAADERGAVEERATP